MLLGAIPKDVFSGGFVAPGKMRNRANQLIEEFQIKVGSAGDAAGSLSGGNQQKIVAARTLSQKPRVVVAVNPTRGLDLKATNYVHSRLIRAADEGAAVFLFSTDLDELAALADRTVYMDRGCFTAEFLVGPK